MDSSEFPVICAWCQSHTGSSSTPDSHGMCAACYESFIGVPRLDSEQLDALPFGVIELDANGIVLFYNRAESDLSGRDPAEVIGRNFFTEVAPCTRVKAFADRFSALLAGGIPMKTFEFTFRFPERSVDVSVALVRLSAVAGFVIVQQKAPHPTA